MVRVVMGEEHGIHPVDAVRDQLYPQLRRRVDQQSSPVIRLHDRPHPRALVARIRRPADGALAANLRHAETGAGSQKRELQISSTLSKLVLPGTSNGTPAVTSTRSPACASPCATAAARASGITAS
jgi:hypothetical protein